MWFVACGLDVCFAVCFAVLLCVCDTHLGAVLDECDGELDVAEAVHEVDPRP